MEYSDPRRIGDILKEKERNIEIIGADLATRHGFTQVPNFILTNKDISVGAKLAYAMLLKYVWTNDSCFPGQVTLAEDMGATDRSVRHSAIALLLKRRERLPLSVVGWPLDGAGDEL
jgi:hypothetical protein